MANAHTLQQEIQASFWTGQEFSAVTAQSAKAETDTTAARLTYATENPELGIFQTGKQTAKQV